MNTPATINDQIALAKELASSNLLPEQYRQKPANLLWAVQYAQALGVHPMTAVTGIAVINGKPTASAQLIGGLVRRAGHKLRVESTDTKAVATLIRADDPTFEFRVEWTMDRARKAGLGGRGPWQQYPAAMLAARAITEVARMGAPEALFGIIYTAEELGADVDDDGAPTHAAGPQMTAVLVDHINHAPANAPASAYDVEYVDAIEPDRGSIYDVEPEPAGSDAKGIARNQTTRIAILRRELGITDEAYRKRLVDLYNVTTSKELTQAQAADLIEKLTAAKQRGGASESATA